jgi:tetratricopeptide (TPR) repeat protein
MTASSSGATIFAEVSEHPDREAILAALDRIVSSETFVRSDRLCRFLRFVVARTLDGRGDDLKEYLLGVEVCDKGPAFDPRLDSCVRVDARRLRTKLEEYYAREGMGESVRIGLPKGSYIPTFSLVVRDSVPEPGTSRNSTRPAEMAGGETRSAPWLLATLGLVAIFWGVWFVWGQYLAGPSTTAEVGLPSVLPIVNLNSRGGNEAERTPEERELDTLLIQAGHQIQRRAEPSLLRAIEYADRSLGIRPAHAVSHAVAADAWLALADHRQGAEQAGAINKARDHARAASKSDGSLAGPYTTLAAIAMDYEWDWKQAESLLRRAALLNPSHGLTHARYARLLSLQGRHEESLVEARHAESLSPVSVTAIASVGHALFYGRRYDEAIAQLNRALDIDSSYDNARLTIAKCYGFRGRYAEAWDVTRAISPVVQQSPEAAALRAFLYGREGRIAEARREIPHAARASSISRATALSAMGDTAEALWLLEQSAASREINVVYVKISPGIDPLRRDPRLARICAQVGLSGCTVR